MDILCRAGRVVQACGAVRQRPSHTQNPALRALFSKTAGMLAIVALGLVMLVPATYAAEMIEVSDQRKDASAGDDTIMLQYDGFGIDVSEAVLGGFSFLGLTVEFDESGAPPTGPYLVITLLDDVFDPVFSEDYEILIIADAGPHDDFAVYPNRTLAIYGIPTGIEIMDLYLDRVKGTDDVVDESEEASLQTDTSQDDEDAKSSLDESPGVPVDDAADVADVSEPDDIISDEIDADPMPEADDIISDEIDADPMPEPDNIISDEIDADPMPEPDNIISDEIDADPIPEPSTGDTIMDSDAGMDSDAHGGNGNVDATVGSAAPNVQESAPPADEPELAGSTEADACGPGTILDDGVCVIDTSFDEGADAGDATDLPDATASSPDTGTGRDLIYAAVVGFVVAGAISVVLALLSRASRRRRASDAKAGADLSTATTTAS